MQLPSGDTLVVVKPLTRAQLNAAAAGNQLIQDALYLITDENRLTVATSAGAHSAHALQGETGGGGIVAKVKVTFTAAGAMTLVGAENVSSVTRTGAGMYTVNFAKAIPAGCVLHTASGRFGDNNSFEGMAIGIDRRAGNGISTTAANLVIHAEMIASALYDPYNGATANSWLYVAFSDPTVSIVG